MIFRTSGIALALVAFAVCESPTANAQLSSPQVGWQAEFSTLFHDVSGTATILDEDTLQFDNFTYDGEGISVYFYLGESNTSAAFANGLQIGELLLGTIFDGTEGPFTVDLPAGQTLEGRQAISVWCVPASANFGSGSFMPVPEPTTCGLIVVAMLCYSAMQRATVPSAGNKRV